MKLDDDYNSSYEKGKYQSTLAAVIVFTVIAVVIVVLIANADKIKRRDAAHNSVSVTASSVVESVSEEEYSYGVSSLHPEDLDFYQMYKGEDNTESVSESVSEEETVELGPEEDGKHTLVTYYDGTTEWVSISKYITKNIYDYTNLYNQDGIMEYSKNGHVISSFGVDISKDQDYVDFNKLKKAGCDFVMIRVGQRGYTSGQITIDEYFEDNIRRASQAGLEIGVYFWSQAVTEEEAIEEAQFVIDNVKDYTLVYPVAFVMQYPEEGTARVEALTRADKTTVTRAFLKKIEEAGYKSVVYGDKAWLIKYLELNKVVSDYDVWLSEEGDLPTYPYEYTMWQYNKKGSISGIKGDVSFNISMVDYTLR
ncbi:MAG: hypothetical protein K6A97_08135 [Lachnospiraceae bacterium]|nr:hypothetical protein [Lachnospiraceae bacterium]